MCAATSGNARARGGRAHAGALSQKTRRSKIVLNWIEPRKHLTNTIAASAAPARFPTSFDGLLTSIGGRRSQVDTSVCCASPPSSAPSFGRLLAMPQSPAVPTGAACLPVVRASASTFGADEQNQVHADGMR